MKLIDFEALQWAFDLTKPNWENTLRSTMPLERFRKLPLRDKLLAVGQMQDFAVLVKRSRGEKTDEFGEFRSFRD